MRTSFAPTQRLGSSERSPKRWESRSGRSSSHSVGGDLSVLEIASLSTEKPRRVLLGNLQSYTRIPIRYRGEGKRLVQRAAKKSSYRKLVVHSCFVNPYVLGAGQGGTL